MKEQELITPEEQLRGENVMFVFTTNRDQIQEPLHRFNIEKMVVFYDEGEPSLRKEYETMRLKEGLRIEFVPLEPHFLKSKQVIQEQIAEEKLMGNHVYLNLFADVVLFSVAAADVAYATPDQLELVYIIQRNEIIHLSSHW